MSTNDRDEHDMATAIEQHLASRGIETGVSCERAPYDGEDGEEDFFCITDNGVTMAVRVRGDEWAIIEDSLGTLSGPS
jgi:hypothetical protein